MPPFTKSSGVVDDVLIIEPYVSLIIGIDSLTIRDDRDAAKVGWEFGSRLSTGSQKVDRISFYDILWAQLNGSELIIQYVFLSTKDSVRPAELKYVLAPFRPPYLYQDQELTAAWIEMLLARCYGNSQPRRRAKILLNPHSGQGNAEKLYSLHVEPILKAAQYTIDVVRTSRRGEGIEIVEKMDINRYDVVMVCSGDGLVHEVFNGLGKRPDAKTALAKIPVAHIPCGSGNGTSYNLNGTGSVSKATLAIVKGVSMPLDLVSITQGNERYLSFLSQALGMSAETDLGTENMRWIGSARFIIGFLMRLAKKTVYPADIAVKVAIRDKDSIKRNYIAQKKITVDSMETMKREIRQDETTGGVREDGQGLPPLNFGTINDKLPEDWELISCDQLGTFYCGNMAHMAEDAQFFPAAMPNDGLLDLVVLQGDIKRREALRQLEALRENRFFSQESVGYLKILAYRVTPKRQESGYISIDGESVPFQPFQAEVHQGLGRVISKSGYFYEAAGVFG